MTRQPLSLVVTTLDNAATLARCLDSAAFADDIVVLDSGSSDATVAIARERGARIFVEPFKGYGPQKQSALDKARHDWVLLLDADEELTAPAAAAIERALVAPQAAGYTLPRREWLFWRWPHPGTRLNRFLRLFDRRRGRMGSDPIHAAPRVDGPVLALDAPFLHHGERDLHTKVDKINHYSTGLVADARPGKQRFLLARMLLYPHVVFLRQYLFKRQFLNGSAGLIASATMAWYAFLKSAKRLEARKRRDGDGDGRR
jgi:glycosyltransferase involved in cell wall biosynthesis